MYYLQMKLSCQTPMPKQVVCGVRNEKEWTSIGSSV